jgi:RES domain-containing protein
VARTGEGARITGGRWTSPGHPAVYCAEHLSLATLEVLVHAPGVGQRAVRRVRFRIRLEPGLVVSVDDDRLPPDFSPRTPFAVSRRIGDAWIRALDSPALSVPSAIVPSERNVILNPVHPRFGSLKWDSGQPIHLDERVWAVSA